MQVPSTWPVEFTFVFKPFHPRNTMGAQVLRLIQPLLMARVNANTNIALDDVSSYESGRSSNWCHSPEGACTRRSPSACDLKMSSKRVLSGWSFGSTDSNSAIAMNAQPLPRAQWNAGCGLISWIQPCIHSFFSGTNILE